MYSKDNFDRKRFTRVRRLIL
ncbi:MAG: NUDIX hydrolase N-terminal domain-containing protein [Saprospiraceae bacterium]|nr:NUDIX hydrolase N-terminal domain-containing protein [Saprospiraceae bacterium]